MAKYRVYGNYVFSKVLGEYEAESEKEAIIKALDESNYNTSLCSFCSREFVDGGELDEGSCVGELIEE